MIPNSTLYTLKLVMSQKVMAQNLTTNTQGLAWICVKVSI
jgi:hypothetical protein